MILAVCIIVALMVFALTIIMVLAIKNKRSSDMFYRMRRHSIIKGRTKPGEVEDVKTKVLKFVKELAKPLVEKNFAQF